MRTVLAVVVAVAGLAVAVAPTSAAAQVDVEQLNPQPRPSERRSSGAALQPLTGREQLWTFGGFAAGSLGDLWRFDTAALTWTEVTDTTPPSARDQHGLGWDESQQRVILFGGVRLQGISVTHMNDVWSLDPATAGWTQLSTNTPAPVGRSSSAFFYIPHRGDFIMFGGWDVRPTFPFGTAGGYFGDSWRLDVNAAAGTATWTRVTPTGTPPSARAATCGAYDEARHKLVLFGGETGLDANGDGIAVDETWELDVDTLAFTQVTTTNTPRKRSFCAAAFDAGADRLLVYGGQDGPDLVDGMFSYDPATTAWTAQTIDVAIGTLSDQAATFSPHLGAMVMFGGRVSGGAASVYDDETFTLDLQSGGPPLCGAGPDQIVDEGAQVALDGSASSDPDGTPLSFAWRQLSGPAVTLADPSGATPAFTAPTLASDAALVFELTVDDGLDAAVDLVTINVRDVLNDPPVADAGSDLVAIEGALVTLNGGASSDPDGDPLGFSWLQIGGAAVVLDDPTSPAPRFLAPVAGGAPLEFSLIVDDGSDASTADVVAVVVTDAGNAPPVASAGLDVDTAPGVEVALDGSASFDADGGNGSGASLAYAWSQLSGPPVLLDDDTTAAPVFFAPVVLVDTVIVLRLVVSDGVFQSAPDDVSVTVRAALGAPRFASLPRNLAASGLPYSYDADDSVAATGTGTRFTLVSGPPGLAVDPDTGLVTWTPDVAGTFAVELLADNASGEDAQRFNVEVYAPPLITSTPSTTFDLGRPYTYDQDDTVSASGSGPLAWSLLEGPPGMVVEVETGRVTWVALFPDAVTVRLRVENAFGADEQQFVLSRPPETVPRIARTANLFAAVGRRYLYDNDGAIGIENLRPGDITIVAPRAPVPSGLIIVPQVSGAQPMFWRPQAEGVQTIGLTLISVVGLPLDLYQFDVQVVALDPEGLARADAQATPTSGPAPLRVLFAGDGSRGSAGAPLWAYGWNTGDGVLVGNVAPLGTAASPAAEHSYSTPGSYTAELEVQDAYGVFATDKVTISVLDGTKQPPTARIVADVLEGRDQLTVSFSCDCADPDGGALAGVLWSYGDGTTATQLSPTHTYVQPGNYRARLTTFDVDGLTGTDSVDVRVRAGDLAPPQARIAASPGTEGDQPMNVVLEAATGDDDGVVVDVRWSLPDGSVRTGARVETTFPTAGYFPVLLEAEDNDGLVGRDLITIAVRSDGVRPPLIVSQPASRSATAGVPWRYDVDDRATAQGGRPIVWRLGKTIDGERVNAPAGMEVSIDGFVEWTPSAAQIGEQRITLVAENGAGADLQELIVTVLPGAAGADGCGCRAGSPAAGAPFAALLALLSLGRRRRHLRQAAVAMGSRGVAALGRAVGPALALVIVLAVPVHAAPGFTSSAPGAATAGEVFEYLASVDGEPPIAFALADAPAGMVVDSIDGHVQWMPTSRATVDVVLLAADRTGVVEQRFTLDVAGGTPAAFDFVQPEDGFQFRTDAFGTVEPGIFIVPSLGEQPKQFYAESDSCMYMLVNGGAIFHRAHASSCAPTMTVANPWGHESRTLDVHFVEPPPDEKLFVPLLSASTLAGAAPLLVTFDGTASRMPADDSWSITAVFYSGEDDGELLDSDAASMITEYVYTTPGTYEATLTILAHDNMASLVNVLERSSVTIVVADEGVQPPSTTLIVDQAAGPAPLEVRFQSGTVPSDAPIVAYALDFGDGARFEVTTTAFGSFAEPSPSHVYGAPGSYRAQLSVIDALGRVARASIDIVVRAGDGSPPAARILAFPTRGEVPLTVNLAAEVNDVDGYLVSQTWILPGGAVSAEPNPTFVIDEPGEHTVELIVLDDSGLQTRARTNIAATRDGVLPPRVISLPNKRAVAGQAWRYDEDGALSVTGGGPYRFALGKLLDGRLVNAPAGMTIDERTGAVAWTPPLDGVGEAPVSFLVENAAGSTLHELVLIVEPAPPELGPLAPQSCASAGGACFAWALAALAAARRARRR